MSGFQKEVFPSNCEDLCSGVHREDFGNLNLLVRSREKENIIPIESLYERRTNAPSLETCLTSVRSPGNHACSL